MEIGPTQFISYLSPQVVAYLTLCNQGARTVKKLFEQVKKEQCDLIFARRHARLLAGLEYKKNN
jgi:hypothetical protein